MPLDLSAVGREAGPVTVAWTSRDAMLYALGVGAGQADPFEDLQFTTENTDGVTQQVLPTYAVVLTQLAGIRVPVGDIDRTKLVHGEQALVLHRPLAVEGRVALRSRITGIYDKGSGALVTYEGSAQDPDSGELVFETKSSSFIRGEGGFGGPRGEGDAKKPLPDRAPDVEVVVPTRADQALLYRLSGDRNPLHSDPAFAARGGFTRPILHGLCTWGISARVLLKAGCNSDPKRFRSFSGRFTKPVLPGDTLKVQGWREGNEIRFRTLGNDGAPVIDGGRFEFAA